MDLLRQAKLTAKEHLEKKLKLNRSRMLDHFEMHSAETTSFLEVSMHKTTNENLYALRRLQRTLHENIGNSERINTELRIVMSLSNLISPREIICHDDQCKR